MNRQTKIVAGSGRRETFSLVAPGAKSVQLVGDFTHWNEHPIALRKGNGGLWRARTRLISGSHPYRFLVDGEWRDDPECRLRVPNPYGGQDCVRQVG
jgi:1,4-alpha-glucan branching enzyme